MKFLVDAQLPKLLSDFLKSKGFDSIHTIDLVEKNKTGDSTINKLALEENRIVVTKDNDFIDSFFLSNTPKKLLLITTGNISNKKLLYLISLNLSKIVKAFENSSLVEISQKEIIIHQ